MVGGPDDPDLLEGIRLFNDGQHWHAHESWEHLWLRLDGDEKRFVQGLIMAAAMLHQYKRGIVRGVVNHHENVLARLSGRSATWGIDVPGLLAQLQPFRDDAGSGEMARDAAAVRIEAA